MQSEKRRANKNKLIIAYIEVETGIEFAGVFSSAGIVKKQLKEASTKIGVPLYYTLYSIDKNKLVINYDTIKPRGPKVEKQPEQPTAESKPKGKAGRGRSKKAILTTKKPKE